MAFNPKLMMQAMQRIGIFRQQHPKFGAFLANVTNGAVREGSVIEIKVTDPNGAEYISNIRVTAEDMETIEMMKNMQQ